LTDKLVMSAVRGLAGQFRGYSSNTERGALLLAQSELNQGGGLVIRDGETVDLAVSRRLIAAAPSTTLSLGPYAGIGEAFAGGRAATPEEVKQAQAIIERKITRSEVAQQAIGILEGTIDPIKPNKGQGTGLLGATGRYAQGLSISTGESFGAMAPIMFPMAGVLIAQGGYADAEYQKLREEGNDPATAHAAAQMTGALEAGFERAAFLFNFVPTSTIAKLTAAKAGSKLMGIRPALETSTTFRILSKMGTTQAAEYGEEIAQAAAPILTGFLGEQLGWNLAEQSKFLGEWKQFKEEGGFWRPEVFATVMMLAVSGGGYSGLSQSVQAKAAMTAMLGNQTRLESMGIAPAKAAEIVAMPETERQAAYEAAYPERNPSAPEAVAAQKLVTAEVDAQKAKGAAEVQAMESEGLSITRTADGWAVTDLTEPDTAPIPHATAEEAMTTVRGIVKARGMKRQDSFLDALDEYVSFMESGRTIQLSNKSTNLLKELETAVTQDNKQWVEDIWDRADQERTKVGLDVLERDKTNPDSAAALFGMKVLGRSKSAAKGNVANAISYVMAGGQTLDLVEEQAENDLGDAVAAGETTTETVEAIMRRIEAFTGDQYIFSNTAQGIKEAWSALVRLYTTGTKKGNKITKGARQETAEALRIQRQAVRKVEESLTGEATGTKKSDLREKRQKLIKAEEAGITPAAFAKMREYLAYLKGIMGQVYRLQKARDAGLLDDLEAMIRESVGLKEQDALEAKVAEAVPTTYNLETGQGTSTFGYSISTKRDADYMAAVESGDVATQQAMVDEAAKAAGLIKITRTQGDGAPSGYYERTEFPLKVLQQTEGAVRRINDGTFDELVAELDGVDPMDVEPLVTSPLYDDGTVDVYNGNHRVEVWKNYQVLPGDTAIPVWSFFDETDPITYDESGNVIPLSQRFNPESANIGYSIAARRDADYMAAVESGDTVKQRTLVDDAAKAAGIPYVGVNINDSDDNYTGMILSGEKTVETRNSENNAFRNLVGERVAIVRTGTGKATVVGYATVGTPIRYNSAEEFNADFAKHRVTGGKFAFSGFKIGYPMENVTPIDAYEAPPSNGQTVIKTRPIHALVDYDEQGNVIPLSERFGLEQEVDPTSPSTEPGEAAPNVPITNPDEQTEADGWQDIPWTTQTGYAIQYKPDAYPPLTKEIYDKIKSETDNIYAVWIDRMKVGSYKGIDLQGGMFYPTIEENLEAGVVWAYNADGVASGELTKAAQTGGYMKLILMQEGNIIGNKTFTACWFLDVRENIANGKLTSDLALKELNRVRVMYQKKTKHSTAWENLEQAEKEITDMGQLIRGATYFQKAQKGGRINYGALLAQKMTKTGFPDGNAMVAELEESAMKGLPIGTMVGIIQIDPNQKPTSAQAAGVTPHRSYKTVLKGRPIARMTKYNTVKQLFPEVPDYPRNWSTRALPLDRGVGAGYSIAPARKTSLEMQMTRDEILDAIEKSKDWKDFYTTYQYLLDEYFGDDATAFQSILSITSQAASVKANVAIALRMYGYWKRGEEFDGKKRGEAESGALSGVLRNLERWRDDVALSGRKISNYQAANEGKEGATEKVVVDRHIANMLFGTKTPTGAQFTEAEKVLTEIAQSIGWEPRQVQAALWAASIRKSGTEPASYDQYLKTLRERGTIYERTGATPGAGGIFAEGVERPIRRPVARRGAGKTGTDGYSITTAAGLENIKAQLDKVAIDPDVRFNMMQRASENLAKMVRDIGFRDDVAAAANDAGMALMEQQQATAMAGVVDRYSAEEQQRLRADEEALKELKAKHETALQDLSAKADIEAGGAQADGWTADQKDALKVRQRLEQTTLQARQRAETLALETKQQKATDAARAKERQEVNLLKQEQAAQRKANEQKTGEREQRATMLDYLAALDTILMPFPAEVRNKVGGFVSLAGLRTNAAMNKYLKDRVEKLNTVLENYLRKDYAEQIKDLIKKGDAKRASGKKPGGKLGAEGHALFDAVKAAAGMSEEETNKAIMDLSDAIEKARSDNPDAVPVLAEKLQAAVMFGDLNGKTRTARDLANALKWLKENYERERTKWRMQEEAWLAEITRLAAGGVVSLDGSTTASDRLNSTSELGEFRAGSSGVSGSLRALFGKDSELYKRWTAASRRAIIKRTNEWQALQRDWRDMKNRLYGKGWKGDRKLYDEIVEPVEKSGVLITDKMQKSRQTIPVSVAENILAGKAPELADRFTDEEKAEMRVALDANILEKRPKDEITLTRISGSTVGSEITLSQGQAMQISLMWRQEQGRAPMEAHGYTEETIAQVEAFMSPRAKALRDWISARYTDEWGDLNTVFARMFGVNLPQIPNYAPLTFWSQQRKELTNPDPNGGPIMAQGGMSTGMLKDRVEKHGAEPRIVNAVDVFFDHMRQLAHFKAFAELAREMRAVMSKPEIRRALDVKHGKNGAILIDKWMDAIEQGGLTQKPGWFEDRMAAMGGARAVAVLAWNFKSAFTNVLNLLGMARKMPPDQYLKGIVRLFGGRLNWWVGKGSTFQSSEIIQRRLNSGISPEMQAAMARIANMRPGRLKAFMEGGMALHSYSDAIFTSGSVAIAYDYHLREFLKDNPPAEAQRMALAATEQSIADVTQPTEFLDKSTVELERNAMQRQVYAFQSDQRQKLALQMEAYSEKDWGHLIKLVMIDHVVTGLIMQTITNAWRDANDDEDGDDIFDPLHWQWKDYLIAMALGPWSALPMFGPAIDSIAAAFKNGPANNESLLTAAGSWAGKGFKTITSEKEKPEPFELTSDAIKNAAIGSAIMTGDARFAVVARVGSTAFDLLDNYIETADESAAHELKMRRLKDKELNPPVEKTDEEKAQAKIEKAAKDLRELERLREEQKGK
jgi:hypothetical protein